MDSKRQTNRVCRYADGADHRAGRDLAAGAKADAQEQGTANPFAYDISRFQKTNPKIITYKEVTRWPLPRKEARRMAIGPDNQLYVCAGNYINSLSRAGEGGLELALTGPTCCVAVALSDRSLLRSHSAR
jgi:hypothetical protein